MIEKIGAIEQASLSLESALARLQIDIETLRLLELEQTQSIQKAERQNSAILADYVGDSSDPIADFRRLNLRAHVKARGAIKRARKLAFVSRRALEMKMVVNLSDETQAGPFVEPPAMWANDLFGMYLSTSIYDPSGSGTDAAYSYLRRLEDYVYNYPFQFPFANGSSQAVISLRDDLMSLDEKCFWGPGEINLLIDNSEQFNTWGFNPDYVEVYTNAAYGPEENQVMSAEKVVADLSPLTPGDFVWYMFGSKGTLKLEDIGDEGIVASVYIRGYGDGQETLAVGVDALYWYEGEIFYADTKINTNCSLAEEDGWHRCSVGWEDVAPPPEGTTVSFRMVLDPIDWDPDDETVTFDIWGTQIELCKKKNLYEYCIPREYQRTPVVSEDCVIELVENPWGNGLVETIYYPVQEKQKKMRAEFSAKCVNDDRVVEGQTPTECVGRGGVDYLETHFSITLEGIENGSIIGQGQIGAGNYNYRIENMAVNLVGTNIKDCSLDPGGSTSCYGNNFIPYDLTHGGNVKIRNHAGNDLPFTFQNGRIHEGKAVAAEILLTNPLSQTNHSIIDQYLQSEFRGRPIQGNYTLRIYAVPSLRWENVEDIQLLLNYTYWSAFSNP
jgi:hypothetical protein